MSSLGGHHISRQATLPVVAVAVLFLLLSLPVPLSAAVLPPTPPQDSELVLVVDLDGEIISDSFLGIERSGKLYVPICAVAEAISLAITCADGRAFGFVLKESRPFVVDLETGFVISGRSAFHISDAAFRSGQDIFVDIAEASKWLPVDFNFNKNSSTLQLQPREALPVQEFKKRQRLVKLPPTPLARHFEDFTPPRQLASAPTIDVATQLQLTGEEHSTMKGVTLNSLDMTGDLLYMSGEAHLSAESETLKRLDITLFRRRDPGFMAGPVPVTQIRLGSSQVPYIDGIGASAKPMYGIYLSNRPIFGSTNFLRHNINGSLPQGWDAELFHNGIPIGYQPPTSDNMYHFQNLLVYYGINNFKVILHGPFGERRESEEIFVSDSITPKGEFLYTVSSLWETGITDNAVSTGSISSTGTGNGTAGTGSGAPQRESNITLTSDFGLARNLTGAGYLVRHTDLYGVERNFAGIGLRTALSNTLLSMDLIGEYYPAHAGTGGILTFKSSTRDFVGVSLEATQRLFWNYDSPQYPANSDPLVSKTTLKANSSFTAYNVTIPLSLLIDVDTLKSGEVDEISAWRISGGWNGWNGALEADLSYRKRFNAAAIFQVSTKVREIILRGQANFSFAPDVYASTVNLSADKDLGSGYFLNTSVSHDPTNEVTEFKAGVSKRFGLISYSFSGTATTRGAFSLTAGLRTSLGPDPSHHQAIVSSEPLSPYGMIAVSAVLAEAAHPAGKRLPNIGFLVNGNTAATVAGTKGVPVIVNLQPDVPVDVTVDLATVEDPFMIPVQDGCRITPRAGVVAACKFTMTTGGEIDGMVFVHLPRGDVPLKDVRVDLVSDAGKLLASTRSQESGYYLFKAVRPGNYQVSIPDAESARLRTAALPPIAVAMPAGGDLVSGKDFHVVPLSVPRVPF